jgi:hypothetical protein
MTGTFKAFTYHQQNIKPEYPSSAALHIRVHTLHPAKLCDPVQSPATRVVLL